MTSESVEDKAKLNEAETSLNPKEGSERKEARIGKGMHINEKEIGGTCRRREL